MTPAHILMVGVASIVGIAILSGFVTIWYEQRKSKQQSRREEKQ